MTHRLQGIVIVKTPNAEAQSVDTGENPVEQVLDDLLGYNHFRPSSFTSSGYTAYEVEVDAADDEVDQETIVDAMARATDDESVMFVDLTNPLRPRAHSSMNSVNPDAMAQAADRLASFVTSSFMSLATDIQRR